MKDVFNSGYFYLSGEVTEGDVDEVIERIAPSWRDSSTGRRLFMRSDDLPLAPDNERIQYLIGPKTAAARYSTNPPWDDASRSVWGPLLGYFVDELLIDLRVESWVLICDEGYIVGYWHRSGPDGPVGVVNSVVGRETYSLRPELSYMLMDRFSAAGIDYELADLGDLPGGISTADE